MPNKLVSRIRNGKTQVYALSSKYHGESKSNLYRRWKKMKERCSNKNANNYRWYGGRGIYVCDEWKNNYLKFKEWALENGYSEHMELDRINNDGPYSPENCRWVTKLTNMQSRANYLTPEMEEKLKERADKEGISIHSVIKNALEAYL